MKQEKGGNLCMLSDIFPKIHVKRLREQSVEEQMLHFRPYLTGPGKVQS